MRRQARSQLRTIAFAIAAAIALVVLGICLQTRKPFDGTGSGFRPGGSAGSGGLGDSAVVRPAESGGNVSSGTAAAGKGDESVRNATPSGMAGLFAQLAVSPDEDGCIRGQADLAGDVPEAAAEVLFAYRDRGDCLLAESGYLDLYGDAWGCVIQGEGWVDVCVLRGEADGDASVATVVRMDAAAWATTAAAEGYGLVDEGAG